MTLQLLMESYVTVLQAQFQQDPNPRGVKMAIKQRMRDVENLAFWKSTSEPHELLENYWQSNVHSDKVFKVRLQSFISAKTTEVQLQLLAGVSEMHGPLGLLDKQTGTQSQPQPAPTSRHRKNKSLQVSQSNPLPAPLQQLLSKDFPLNNHDYFSPHSKKTQQTQQYLKSLKRDYKRFKQEMDKKKKEIEQQKSERMYEEMSHQQMVKEEVRKKREKEVQDKIQNMKQEREKREDDIKRFREFYREYKHQKPLHVLMEEEYKEKIELPLLQQRKNKMLLRPHNKKPTLEELNEHQDRYMEMKRGHNKTLTISHQLSVPYRSKFYKEASHHFQQSLDVDNYESQAAQKLAKIQKYAEYVNQNLKPKVDFQKRKEVEERIKASMNNFPLSALSQRQEDTIAKAQHIRDRKYTLDVGNRYLEYVHRKVKKSRAHVNSLDMTQQKSQDEPPERPQAKTNYLEEQKRRHANMRSALENWEKDLHDPSLTEYDRRQRVLLKSKLMEENALRKERSLLNNDQDSHVEKIEKKKQIDDALLQAIKAKMAVLKG